MKKRLTDSGLLLTLEEELAGLLGQSDKFEPHAMRFKTNDPTVAKLTDLLQKNPNGMILVRDELSGFLRNLDAKGHEGDREFYLEAWNGTESFDVDRIGRGTIHLKALCLSIYGGIQPAKFQRYVSASLDGGWGDDGLLQRFQLLIWPELPKGRWSPNNTVPDQTAWNRVLFIYRSLASLNATALGVEDDE